MTALTLMQTAEDLMARSRPAAALPLISRALRGGGDRFFQADAFHLRAEALRALSHFTEALKDYWSAHRLYRLCGVRGERLRALLGASACLRVLSRYSQADRMWRSVVHLLSGVVDPAPEEFQVEMALVRRGLGDAEGAARLLRSSIPRLKRRGDAEALQHAWWALAGAERFAGRYGGALSAFRKAERLARRNGDRSAQAYAWCGMGGCLRILGKGGESFRLYRRAHARFKGFKDRFGEAYGLCGMANALRTYGDARKAVPLYRRSAALYKDVGDRGSRAFALWGLGGAHRRMGRREESLRFYRESLRDFKKAGDTRGVLMAFLGLGRTLGEAGRCSEAHAFFEKARELAVRRRHPYEAALARVEPDRLNGRPLNVALFARFGVQSKAVLSWKDVP